MAVTFGKIVRYLGITVIIIAAGLVVDISKAAEFYSTLAFRDDGLNLETQAVEQRERRGHFRDAVDFHLAYHADRENPSVLVQNQKSQVLIAFLDGEPFELVDSRLLADLTFTQHLVDVPFDNDDTAVLLTSEGNYYKVGNAVDNGDGTVTVQSADL